MSIASLEEQDLPLIGSDPTSPRTSLASLYSGCSETTTRRTGRRESRGRDDGPVSFARLADRVQGGEKRFRLSRHCGIHYLACSIAIRTCIGTCVFLKRSKKACRFRFRYSSILSGAFRHPLSGAKQQSQHKHSSPHYHHFVPKLQRPEPDKKFSPQPGKEQNCAVRFDWQMKRGWRWKNRS